MSADQIPKEIPERYYPLFVDGKFQRFHPMQLSVLDDVSCSEPSSDLLNYNYLIYVEKMINSDRNIVLSAPTGSGKTVAMEFALIRALERSRNGPKPSVVYR